MLLTNKQITFLKKIVYFFVKMSRISPDKSLDTISAKADPKAEPEAEVELEEDGLGFDYVFKRLPQACLD